MIDPLCDISMEIIERIVEAIEMVVQMREKARESLIVHICKHRKRMLKAIIIITRRVITKYSDAWKTTQRWQVYEPKFSCPTLIYSLQNNSTLINIISIYTYICIVMPCMHHSYMSITLYRD